MKRHLYQVTHSYFDGEMVHTIDYGMIHAESAKDAIEQIAKFRVEGEFGLSARRVG